MESDEADVMKKTVYCLQTGPPLYEEMSAKGG